MSGQHGATQCTQEHIETGQLFYLHATSTIH